MTKKQSLSFIMPAFILLAACAISTEARMPLASVSVHGMSLEQLAEAQSIELTMPLAPTALGAIAVRSNPDLNALRAREKVAEAQVFAAGLYPDPTVSAGLDFPTSGAGAVTAIAGGIGYDFAAIARRPIALRAARANVETVRMDIAWAEWLTAERASLLSERIGYLSRIKSQTARFRALADKELKSVLDAVARGDLPAAELDARRIAATDAADRDRTAELQLRSAQLDLNRTLGLDPFERLDVTPPAPLSDKTVDFEILVSSALMYRADLAGMRANYAAAGAAGEAARLNAFPLPSLGINAARDTGSVETLGPSLSFVLPIWNRGRGDIRSALATDAQLRAEYVAHQETIRADIASALAALEITRKQRADILQQIEPLVRQTEATQQAAERGDIPEASFNAASMTLLDKQITETALSLSIRELENALEISVGRPLETLK
ncbi:TolC family protein [Hyphomonas oceanitis]|uniref:Outer membrane efflux protein n=1 Tax=Hyphomonas oceanitis SCH89 TaxID=1280953 RepID=A0A059G2C5_9PROT|nr:TolC family protein [Hyphomonas oceanitis]KDA00941.1 outer membrane efflux protein [Hyphomonas oceanitis SCH89]